MPGSTSRREERGERACVYACLVLGVCTISGMYVCYLLDEVCGKQDDDQQSIGQVVLILVLLDHFEGAAGRHGLPWLCVSVCVCPCGCLCIKGGRAGGGGIYQDLQKTRQLIVVCVCVRRCGYALSCGTVAGKRQQQDEGEGCLCVYVCAVVWFV